MVELRSSNQDNTTLRGRFLGVMSTNWGRSGQFAAIYHELKAHPAAPTKDTAQVANFIRLAERAREAAVVAH
jgi:hypothetical protein